MPYVRDLFMQDRKPMVALAIRITTALRLGWPANRLLIIKAVT
jgi:hypothetical protein